MIDKWDYRFAVVMFSTGVVFWAALAVGLLGWLIVG